MGMSRAQAQAYLASQGIYPPSSSYSGTGAVDVLQAARPNPNLGYLQIGAGAWPRLFPGEKTPQEELQEAMAEIARAQAAALRGQTPGGVSTTPAGGAASPAGLGSAGLGSTGLGSYLPSWLGGSSGAATAAPAASGATTAATAAPAAAEAGSLSGTLGTIGGYAAPIAGLAAAGYGGYKLADRKKWDDKNEWGYATKNGALAGAGTGAAIGSVVPVIGTGIGAAVGGLLGGATGFLGAQFGGGKGRDQIRRDTIRRDMKQRGLIDDAYNITLADGNKYDIGKDGSIKNYNVDFSRQGIGDVVSAVNPLAMIVTGGDTKKNRSDLAGYYTNAAASSGDTNANIRKMYSDAGFNHDTAYGQVHEMQKAGLISQEEGDQAKNALDKAFGVGAYAQQRQTNPQLARRNVPQFNNADKSRWK